MLEDLARGEWDRVEFGQLKRADGLRISGAGIASSCTEGVFALDDPSPNRIGFDLERVMMIMAAFGGSRSCGKRKRPVESPRAGGCRMRGAVRSGQSRVRLQPRPVGREPEY